MAAAVVIGRSVVGAGLRGARRRQTLGLLRRGCAGLAVDDTVNGLSEEQRQVGARPALRAARGRAPPAAGRHAGAGGGGGGRPRAPAARLPAGRGGGVSGMAGGDWPSLWGAGLSPGAQRGRGADPGGEGAPRTRVRRALRAAIGRAPAKRQSPVVLPLPRRGKALLHDKTQHDA